MNDCITNTDLSPPLTEPPKAWRNWFMAGSRKFPAFCSICETHVVFQPGEVFSNHCKVHPSKDLAETHARKLMAGWDNPAFYIGAFPEGETP